MTERFQPGRGSAASARLYSRRRFLGAAAVGAGAFALGPAVLTSRAAVASGGTFRQSVASGDPTTNAITLWTKVDDLSDGSDIRLEVFRNEDGTGGVFDSPVSVLVDNPIAKVRLDSLDAGEQYYYRFSTGNDDAIGRFRTARPADSNESVRIAFFSCQEFVSGYYHAHADLAKMDDIDLVVCLGDYVYEKVFDTSIPPPPRMDQTGENRDGEVQSIAEYRQKYDFYHGDPDLLAMRAQHPMTAIWDDHEVEDNYAEMFPGGATDKRRIPYRNRMANGYRAFFEYMPHFPVAGNNTRIHRSIRLGNAEVFLLDARQYRDNQVCAPDDGFFAPGCPATEHSKRDRTLLGDDQLGWLQKGLEESRATWKIVGTPVMIMSLDGAPGNPLNTDSWDGYGDERRRLVEGIKATDNVTFITGDIHTFFAGNVSSSGRGADSRLPPGLGVESRATEFVGGSITSKGIADRVAQDPNLRGVVAFPADGNVRGNNPHIKFSNQAFKGYAILETSSDLDVEYRAVCDVQNPNNKAVDRLARFRVQAGSAEVVVVEDRSATGTKQACGPVVNL